MKPKNKREEVFLAVIEELVKEKNKWETRAKHPLPKGWCYVDEHPCIGEVLIVFPDILTKG